MGVLWVLVVSLLTNSIFLPTTVAVDADCYFTLSMITGTQYSFANKGSPNKYTPGSNCLWQLSSAAGTRININCQIAIPSTTNCGGDKLRVSLSGDSSFSDGKNYCGTGYFTLQSNANYLAVGLYSLTSLGGGTFTCNIQAVQATQPTTAPACDCGWTGGGKIVGGQTTLKHEFPSMVGLVDNLNNEVFCGGTILNSRYVLTAAHCMRLIPVQDIRILVGDWILSSTTDTSATSRYTVYTYWEHPGFNTTLQINDLAIIKTAQVIGFSLYVGPACLPFSYRYESFVYQTVILLGWGQTFFNGPSSDVLLKTSVAVQQNTYCQQQLSNKLIVNGEMCTYASGHDACQQDSGGPAIWQEPNTGRQYVVGIISYGLGCATSKPSVNTRVTEYLDWITSKISDVAFCVK